MKKILKIAIVTAVVIWLGAFLSPRVIKINEPGTGSVRTSLGSIPERSWDAGPVICIPMLHKNITFDVTYKTHEYQLDLMTKDFQKIGLSFEIVHKLNEEALHLFIKDFKAEDDYNQVLMLPLIKETAQMLIGANDASLFFEKSSMLTEAIDYIIKDQLVAHNQIAVIKGVHFFKPKFDPSFEAAALERAIRGQQFETEKTQTQIMQERAAQTLAMLQAEAEGLKLRSEAMTNPLLVQYEIAKNFHKLKLPQSLFIGDGENGVLPLLNWPSTFKIK